MSPKRRKHATIIVNPPRKRRQASQNAMNLKDFPVGSNADFTPMDAGTYNAVCIGIVDLGTQTLDYAGETKHRGQMLILFEFPEATIDVDGATMPRNLSLKVSKSANTKSNLRKSLTARRGKD